MTTLADYLGRIPPYQAVRPKFYATVAGALEPVADAGAVIAGLPAAFDLDTAVGAQLDAVGARVGRARTIAVPQQNLWFAFGDPNRGWGRGIWRGPYATGNSLVALDDDTYRRLLRAKILANAWDGTLVGAQAAYDIFFDDPATKVFIEDDAACAIPQVWFAFGDPARGWGVGRWREPEAPAANIPATDMAMTVGIAGRIPSLVLLAILDQGLIPIKAAGVRVRTLVTSVDRRPLFGFGVDNDYVGGWGRGAWGVPPAYLLDHQG